MVKSLRKRHLQVWSILLVLIPTGIVTAWLSVRKLEPENILQPSSDQVLPTIIRSVNKETYIVRLRTNESGARQLEWINREVLSVPSAVIYKTKEGHKGIESADLIGRIEAKGSYYFPLQKDSINETQKFILYDFIHEQIIDSLNFQQ